MHNPILQDRQREHIEFCKYGQLLLSKLTTDKPVGVYIDTTMDRQTKVY